MSLFRKAGEKFEETKRAIISRDGADFACTSCEKSVTQAYEECPYCGEDAIEPVE